MRAILTYHSVDATGSVISVTPEELDRQIRWLASSRIQVLPLPDLLRLSDEHDGIAITFDDAYTNFLTEAWPRLRDHGLPVTLFVPTRFVGRANAWAELPGGRMPRLPILDWEVLARLHEEGVSLGAHTRTHPDLRALDAPALEEEIAGSFDDLQRQIGVRSGSFCYPYGFWSSRAAAMVRAACEQACTTELRPLARREDAHLLPRLDAYYLNGPGRIDNFGRWSFREYFRLRSHARGLARMVRGAGGAYGR